AEAGVALALVLGSANLLMPHVCCINASNQVLKFIRLFTVRICAASPLTLVSLINTHTHTNTHKIVVLLTVNNDQEHIKISRISLPGCAPGRTPSYTDPSSPCSFDSGTAGSTGKRYLFRKYICSKINFWKRKTLGLLYFDGGYNILPESVIGTYGDAAVLQLPCSLLC
uniref:Uncharacterized protein n=1 Tax=Salarias fasciatus TaxID=181472 RepID=A0A672JCP4_SALFA